jgi:hypothetical protein
MSSGAAGCPFWNKDDMGWGRPRHRSADPATVLPLCCLGKRADLIAAHRQPNPVLQLLELAAIDGDGLFTDAEQPSDLNLDGLYLAIGASFDLRDLPEVFAVRTENGHASQTLRLLAGLRLSLPFLPLHSCC